MRDNKSELRLRPPIVAWN